VKVKIGHKNCVDAVAWIGDMMMMTGTAANRFDSAAVTTAGHHPLKAAAVVENRLLQQFKQLMLFAQALGIIRRMVSGPCGTNKTLVGLMMSSSPLQP
jgi:hypothetical protein